MKIELYVMDQHRNIKPFKKIELPFAPAIDSIYLNTDGKTIYYVKKLFFTDSRVILVLSASRNESEFLNSFWE